MNPNYCNRCESGPLGGVRTDLGVLFADVRGYTSWCEGRTSEEVTRTLNRFYHVAGEALFRRGAIIDKMVGDEVMAVFYPPWLGDKDPREEMLATAREMLRGVGSRSKEGPWLPVGIGVDFGPAFLGLVGAGGVKDFTVLGDVVNIAARLQGEAGPGQVVASEQLWAGLEDSPQMQQVELRLKGKSEAVRARVLDVAAGS